MKHAPHRAPVRVARRLGWWPGALASLIAMVTVVVMALRPSAAHAGRAEPQLHLPVRVVNGDVVVTAQRGLDDVAHRIARTTPARLATIRADLAGLPQPPRVQIRLVASVADIGRVAPAPVPGWADGVAFPRAGIVIVAARRGAQPIDVDRVVTHELAHLALGAALHQRAPRWLDEGFAYLHSSDISFARALTLTGMAWANEATPMFELEQGFPAQELEASRAYAQSYDFVAFLARRGRHTDTYDDGDREPFRAFLRAIAAGNDPYGAARIAYGLPLDQLEGEWYADLQQRYLWAPVGMISLFVWVLAAVLLTIGWWRKRRQARITLARWEREEADTTVTVSLPEEYGPDASETVTLT